MSITRRRLSALAMVVAMSVAAACALSSSDDATIAASDAADSPADPTAVAADRPVGVPTTAAPTTEASGAAGASHDSPPGLGGPKPSTAPPTTNQLPSTTTVPPSPFAPPEWLGTRILSEREKQNSFLLVETPAELVDRRIETRDLLPTPATDEFVYTVGAVPDDVVARSTWRSQCPVALEELSYLTVSHVGFDGEVHTGELIVNSKHAEAVASVFAKLFASRFPLEQMRVIDLPELDELPAGDWNDTTGFTCRDATGNGRWSEHAFGNAIDINPFHNPYLKGDRVIPERAAAYADRTRDLPGMVTRDTEAGKIVVDAFAEIGWGWGGDWNSLKDWMHFSASGG